MHADTRSLTGDQDARGRAGAQHRSRIVRQGRAARRVAAYPAGARLFQKALERRRRRAAQNSISMPSSSGVTPAATTSADRARMAALMCVTAIRRAFNRDRLSRRTGQLRCPTMSASAE